MKIAACAFVLLTTSTAAWADAALNFSGAADCKVATFTLGADEQVAWEGPCKEGYASGTGLLRRSHNGKPAVSYEVTLERGQISDVGSAKYQNGDKYTGFFRDGKPDGKGYLLYANGDQYEGDFRNGVRDGDGSFVNANRDRYAGQWKAGKRDGIGAATYTLGGHYEGSWKANKFDGKGVITYAGSGRRQQALFADGRLAGTPEPLKPQLGHYAIKRDRAEVGTRIRDDVATDFVPSDKPYAALTPEQQAIIKAQYNALEDGDEPPYPEKGKRQLLEWIAKGQEKFYVEGMLRLYVLVGKDGSAQSVTAAGSPSPEITKFASLVLAREKYKPAICHGEPCEMIFPLSFVFIKR